MTKSQKDLKYELLSQEEMEVFNLHGIAYHQENLEQEDTYSRIRGRGMQVVESKLKDANTKYGGGKLRLLEKGALSEQDIQNILARTETRFSLFNAASITPVLDVMLHTANAVGVCSFNIDALSGLGQCSSYALSQKLIRLHKKTMDLGFFVVTCNGGAVLFIMPEKDRVELLAKSENDKSNIVFDEIEPFNTFTCFKKIDALNTKMVGVYGRKIVQLLTVAVKLYEADGEIKVSQLAQAIGQTHPFTMGLVEALFKIRRQTGIYLQIKAQSLQMVAPVLLKEENAELQTDIYTEDEIKKDAEMVDQNLRSLYQEGEKIKSIAFAKLLTEYHGALLHKEEFMDEAEKYLLNEVVYRFNPTKRKKGQDGFMKFAIEGLAFVFSHVKQRIKRRKRAKLQNENLMYDLGQQTSGGNTEVIRIVNPPDVTLNARTEAVRQLVDSIVKEYAEEGNAQTKQKKIAITALLETGSVEQAKRILVETTDLTRPGAKYVMDSLITKIKEKYGERFRDALES